MTASEPTKEQFEKMHDAITGLLVRYGELHGAKARQRLVHSLAWEHDLVEGDSLND